MKVKLLVAMFTLLVISGCANLNKAQVASIQAASYKGYKPIDPLPVSKVKKYDVTSNSEKKVFWASITDQEVKRSLLPIQSSEVSVKKSDSSGNMNYLTASVSSSTGQYNVVMDYMKYRVEAINDDTGVFIGNGRIGVGLRVKANVQTKKEGINLGSILSLGLEAERGNLSGGIAVDVIGIDSEGVTNLIPMTSEIDQTAIQSALQALASVKAKLWEDKTAITPHLVAITEAETNNESEIRSKATN